MNRYIIAALLITLHFNLFGQKEGRLNSKGIEIYYRIFGTGKPLLIINGGPGMNSDGFTTLASILSKNYQAIIYDQRGTGRSLMEKTDSTTVTMQLMIEDIEALRKHLNIDHWTILGHSFGGMLASYYTCFYPEHLQGLILSSSGGIDLELLNYAGNNINSKLSKEEQDSVNYWTAKINNGDTSYNAKLHRASSLASAYVYDKKYMPVIAKRLTQLNAEVSGLVWQDLQRIKFDCVKKLSSFNKPVLIIQGKEDIVEAKTAIKAHKALKNSKIVLMENCVHYGWLDRPDIYFDEIDKFMKISP